MTKYTAKAGSLELSLPELIQYYRKMAELSQAELAKLAGIGKTVVFDLEHGKQTVQWDTVLKVLEILNIRMTLLGPDREFEVIITSKPVNLLE